MEKENLTLIKKNEDGYLTLIPEAIKNISDIEKVIAKLEETKKAYREQLLKEMEERDIIKLETDLFTITRIEESETEYFDKNKFKKEHQELYDSYISMKKRKGYVKIDLVKETD